MNQKLSMSSAIIWIILSVFALLLIYAYASSYLGLPYWIELNIVVINIWISQIIWSRLDPENQETRFGYIFRADLNDRGLVFMSFLVVILSDLVEGYYLKQINFWLGLFISFMNFLVMILIVNLFGSKEFLRTFNQKMRLW